MRFLTIALLLFETKRTHSLLLKMSKRAATSTISDSSKRSKVLNSPALPTGPALPYVPTGFDATRGRVLTKVHTILPSTGDCVVYWMARDQRVEDNFALLYAKSVADSRGIPLKVVFNLVPKFFDATIRQYGFMIKGLQEVEESLRQLHIPMHLTMGDPIVNIPSFVSEHNAALLVTDFSPMRIQLHWMTAVAAALDSSTIPRAVPHVQIDAHNVVPCWVASPKLEYSAKTIRSKITKLFPQYFVDIPPATSNAAGSLEGCSLIRWDIALASLEIDRTVPEVTWLQPGAKGAWQMINTFCDKKLKDYADKRNDPNVDVASHMSPYYHFGIVSPHRVALHVKTLRKFPSSTDAFLEESIIRRELADNFCFYNQRYDDLDSCYEWARVTLKEHASDPRDYLYSREQFERAQTHDDLWNAAQLQMVREGKMHGFLRMYWAKKILEWTPSPQEALAIAIWLNDKYELDGRDPNGYVGCMWSIGGTHDQGWGERKVFGKIRFMNYDGCKRKFDVRGFVSKYK